MPDFWLGARTDEIQDYADKNDMKNFYSSLKEAYCSTSAGSYPLLSADGTKHISEKNKIMERWAEHFDGILNRPSSINDMLASLQDNRKGPQFFLSQMALNGDVS